MSKSIAKRSMKVQVIETPKNQTEQWLVDTVADLAQKAGIGMPEVGYFHSNASNAFATGANRNNALVAVSTGLLERFERNEAKAVLAHEIGHVANGDMVTMTLLQGVLNTVVMILARVVATAVNSALRGNRQGGGGGLMSGGIYFIVYMAAQMLLGVLASIIVMWFSRWREFRADHAGATLADRRSMIAALERLQRESGLPNEMPDELSAFGISPVKAKVALGNLLLSHPPLEVRIAALRNAA
jgi:heat shock protein HtpX